MTLDEIRDYFLSKKGAYEDYPFDDVTAVYKIEKKMFALISSRKSPLKINLKCEPELAIDLRDVYEDVTPGYHMNKKHWNTVNLEGKLPKSEILKMVDLSYDLVVASLTKREREKL